MYHKIECIGLSCDNCGKDYMSGNSGFSIFLDEGSAYESADSDGWMLDDKNHYCDDCFIIDENDNLAIKKVAPIFEVIAEFPENKDFYLGKKITFVPWESGYWQHVVKDCQGERSWLSTWFEQYPHLFKRVWS